MSGPIPIPGICTPGVTCNRDRWCAGMRMSLEHTRANSHRRGLTTVIVTNLHTGKDRLVGVAYRKDAKDRGVMLNTCPFCSASLRFWEQKNADGDRGVALDGAGS